MTGQRRITKLLIANRSEIAIRVMRAATELGIRTVGIYAEQDQFCLHRFKADESYLIGEGLGPVQSYLSIDEMLRVANMAGCDAIHPGYGFLSESPEFAERCEAAGIVFVGPPAKAMRALGNKVSARELAEQAGTPVMPATGPLGEDFREIHIAADAIGYPLMLKASWGGGGRGMRVVESAQELEHQVSAGRSEAQSAFGNGEVYLEKLVLRARHVEVQLLADQHGTVVHLWERDCSVQRRNQKVVERAPAPYLNQTQRETLCASALALARAARYVNAGTAEFLMDEETGAFFFIEVNPRIQVEHTVTEEVTGIDIVKAQLHIAQGAHIGDVAESGVPAQADIQLNGHALQCRITSEDPEANFIPDYGRIVAYRGATGFGIRLDGGTAYSGAVITRYYDSLLEKVTAWAPTPEEAVARMSRALSEFRIRGVATNLAFVKNLINHPDFKAARYTTRFIDETPELFDFTTHRDRASKLLNFIAEVIVNGNPQTKDRVYPELHRTPKVPGIDTRQSLPPGSRDLLNELGPEGFASWMLAQERVLITDTTMRDAHQSLLATRMRSYDMTRVAHAYARHMPQLLSMECWGGATFDVSMRFLNECPWQRLADLRERIPNIAFQMLLRGANGVGYTVYPDNVVQGFVHRAADSGIDLFRVFDSLNWVENMRTSIDAVLESGKLCEAVLCYTGDLFDKSRGYYNLDYYIKLARELQAAGTHILCIKDMAGLLKPEQARILVQALKAETGLPLHLHTHDTSGISAASVLAAVEAGVDAVDAAMDSLSGLTSQPNLGSMTEALRHGPRSTGLDPARIREFSDYWELVRAQYRAFESDLRFGASEVYLHEMPGGQFTNLKEQARSLGLAERWHEVASTYADVNLMMGDIIKVTPSSKMVGDMALAMVSSELTREDVESSDKDVAFPDSVVSFFKGELGQPPNGFPKQLQAKVLKGDQPLESRPGASLEAANLDQIRSDVQQSISREVTDEELYSYLMYPKVFCDFARMQELYGPLDRLPTPVYFYGMKPGDECAVEIERGKTLSLRCLAIGETHSDGSARVFFELNGQPRRIRVQDRTASKHIEQRPKAAANNPNHVPAPMPGMISSVAVKAGQKVASGDLLLVIEAMKMETGLRAERDGEIAQVYVSNGDQVDAKDLLVAFSAA